MPIANFSYRVSVPWDVLHASKPPKERYDDKRHPRLCGGLRVNAPASVKAVLASSFDDHVRGDLRQCALLQPRFRMPPHRIEKLAGATRSAQACGATRRYPDLPRDARHPMSSPPGPDGQFFPVWLARLRAAGAQLAARATGEVSDLDRTRDMIRLVMTAIKELEDQFGADRTALRSALREALCKAGRFAGDAASRWWLARGDDP